MSVTSEINTKLRQRNFENVKSMISFGQPNLRCTIRIIDVYSDRFRFQTNTKNREPQNLFSVNLSAFRLTSQTPFEPEP